MGIASKGGTNESGGSAARRQPGRRGPQRRARRSAAGEGRHGLKRPFRSAPAHSPRPASSVERLSPAPSVITLKLPSVSSTTASMPSSAASPWLRAAARTSSSVTRATRMASPRKRPRKNSSAGSPVTVRRTHATRTLDQVTTYCSPINSAKASTPSASDTSRLSRIVAKVEPSATVTTRSNAFIFDNVRRPDRRNNSTRLI